MTAVALHHVVTGPDDAAPVVLLGSLGSTHESWEPQLAALGRRFRVIACDLRGHGGSPAPPGPYSLDDLVDDVVLLLDELGLARAHVVGLSLGGMVALHLAAREPARVDRLAVLCTSAQLGPPATWSDRAALVRAEGMTPIADAVVARWFTPDYAQAHPDVVARMTRMVRGVPPEGYASCCAAIERMDLRGELGAITARTLAIAGADDPSTPPPHLQRIVDGVRDGRLVVVGPAAHLASYEQADAVNAALLRHLTHGPESAHDDQEAGMDEQGMRTRREVLGDAHVDRAVAATTPFTEPFQDFITRYAWGDVWSRPGLGRRERSMLTLALLTALGHDHELAMHVRAAVGNGVTPDEISEVLLHTAVYAGVPASNRAFAVAQEVLGELGAVDVHPGTEQGEG
jgi:3-oxoadipate enol-lactonase/4-carboxymuconolactone decarboxylase